MSKDLDEFCDELAIKRSFSVPYEKNKNPQSERFWGLILRPMRACMADCNLGVCFWPQAMCHATRLHNHLPSTRLPDQISPYEALLQRQPDLSQFRVFGCKAWYRVPTKDLANKVVPRFVECVHLGRDPAGDGYLCYVPHFKRFTCIPRKARFNENEFPRVGSTAGAREYLEIDDLDPTNPVVPVSRRGINGAANQDGGATTNGDGGAAADGGATEHDHGDDQYFAENHCSHPNCTKGQHADNEPHSFEMVTGDGLPSEYTRQRRAQSANHIAVFEGYWTRTPMVLSSDAELLQPPQSYDEAVNGPFAIRWKESMSREIQGLLEHRTWDVVSRKTIPNGRKPCKSKFVYALKYDRQGNIDKWKSRFVCCGYSQQQGVDFHESYSSTLRASSFRLILALAAYHKLSLDQIDVTSAYTQALIDDVDIWVEPPRGFEEYEADGTSKVLKLNRALYGSRQSGRCWQNTLRNFLISPQMGFTCCILDPCLFVLREGNDVLVLGCYVDDIICAHSSPQIFKKFLTKFQGRFNSKHLGKLSWFLNMAIDQDANHRVSFHQQKYIEDLAKKFLPGGDSLTISRNTPCSAEKFNQVGPAQNDQERAEAANLPYMQLIGSLLYLSTMSRPDISFHLSVLCRCMSDPSPLAYEQALGVLAYLYKTRHRRITYRRDFKVPPVFGKHHAAIQRNMGFHAYSDASWNVPNPSYGFVLFLAGGPVSFVSKNLKSADSSCEAEYSASAKTARDMVYIRNVCHELGFTLHGGLVLGVDNTAAIDVARNLGITARTKHYGREIHYIREQHDRGSILLQWVPTKIQRADLFTKALDPTTFLEHVPYFIQ